MVPLPHRPGLQPVTLLVRRVLQGLLTSWTAVTLAFFILRVAGGDPIASLLSQGLATPDRVEALRESLGLNKPILTQYLDYLQGFLRADFGVSLYSGRPVEKIFLSQAPSTLELAGISLLLALLLGFGLGITTVWKKRSLAANTASTISSLAISLPVASTGLIALLVLGWISRASLAPIWTDSLQSLWLPALVLGFASSGPIARVVQAGLQETLASPYILAARARGLDQFRRLLWHALKPVMPPAVSLIALEAAFLFSGTVITESVFSRPGLGRLLVRSILQGDFPVALMIIGVAAVFYTTSQVLADSFVLLLDPRMQEEG